MRRGLFNHLRRPSHAAPGIIATEDRHDHPVIGADILKPPENAGWDVENIAFLQDDLACIAPTAPEEPPPAFENKKHLGRGM